MGKRFARILYTQNVLKATGESITAFRAFRNGTSNYTTTAVDRGSNVTTAIQAFGFGEATDVIASYSGRAGGNLTGAGVSAAIMGHKALTDAVSMQGFTPANAVIFVGTGTGTDVNSKITGLPYKKRAGESYTIPFGKVTTTDGEFDRQVAIATAVEGQPNRAVSFKPERIYRG